MDLQNIEKNMRKTKQGTHNMYFPTVQTSSSAYLLLLMLHADNVSL